MSEILVVQCSYRPQGTSVMLCKMLKDMDSRVCVVSISDALQRLQQFLYKVEQCSTLVFIGPCYINTYPAEVFVLLEELTKHKEILHNQKIYGVIQGGMPYIHTHAAGLRSLELFANSLSLTYQGGFVLGMGALINGHSLSVLPHGRRVKRQLTIFFQGILDGTPQSMKVCEDAVLRLPVWVMRILSRKMNKNILKEAALKNYDVCSQSPYMKE